MKFEKYTILTLFLVYC